MRFVVTTGEGHVSVEPLDDGRVLLKVRAHGAQLSAADAFALSGYLTRVAIETHMNQVERSLGILARSMRDPVQPHLDVLRDGRHRERGTRKRCTCRVLGHDDVRCNLDDGHDGPCKMFGADSS